MNRNVFVSYKYADDNVLPLPGHYYSTVRNYVDEVEKLLSAEDHIYFGEHDGDDLTRLNEDEIWEKLKDRIYPTSCTIVQISPNMKEPGKNDKYQWIPWEISYSLRQTVRGDRTSHRNAILAVVLPDRNGSYDYALSDRHCCLNGCTTYKNDWMFTIIRENMFNRRNPDIGVCQETCLKIWHGEFSYIPMVRWNYFVGHVSSSIERAERIKDTYEQYGCYDLHLSVNQ